MSTAELAVAVITALGLRELLSLVTRSVIGHMSGRAGRERARVDELIAERDEAIVDLSREREEVDHQAKWRRFIAEHASHLRRLLIENSTLNPADLPPWPPEPPR